MVRLYCFSVKLLQHCPELRLLSLLFTLSHSSLSTTLHCVHVQAIIECVCLPFESRRAVDPSSGISLELTIWVSDANYYTVPLVSYCLLPCAELVLSAFSCSQLHSFVVYMQSAISNEPIDASEYKYWRELCEFNNAPYDLNDDCAKGFERLASAVKEALVSELHNE
jgi:hypothetical protein